VIPTIPTHRVIPGQRRIFWLLYVGYQALYSDARRYVYFEDTALWIKSAADRYCALRATRSREKDGR
jgi:hypothetical protein